MTIPADTAAVRSRSSEGKFALGLTICTALLLSLGMWRHELWRDEAKAWLIARASTSVPELMHNRRFEGHPGLWYLLLYGVTRFTHNPVAMQVLHVGITAAAVYVFARFSPFGRVEKVLFALGYFCLFEYGVISRGYGLGMLLLFCACALLRANRARPVAIALALGLMANTSLYGWFIALAMSIALAVDAARRGGIRTLWGNRRGEALASIVLVVVGLTVAALSIIPPPRVHGKASGQTLTVLEDPSFPGASPGSSIRGIWRGLVPIPKFSDDHFWGTNLFINDSTASLLLVPLLAAALVVGWFCWLMRRSAMAASFFALGVCCIVFFSIWKVPGSVRHQGHLFLLLLAAIWLAGEVRAWREADEGRRLSFAGVVLTLLLFAGFGGGVFAYGADLSRPFSASRAAADFIAQHYPRAVMLVGHPAHAVSPVCAYLDRGVYDPSRGDYQYFELRDGTPKKASDERLLAELERLSEAGAGVLLICTEDLHLPPSDLRIEKVAEYHDGIVRGEQYRIYEVGKGGGITPAGAQ